MNENIVTNVIINHLSHPAALLDSSCNVLCANGYFDTLLFSLQISDIQKLYSFPKAVSEEKVIFNSFGFLTEFNRKVSLSQFENNITYFLTLEQVTPSKLENYESSGKSIFYNHIFNLLTRCEDFDAKFAEAAKAICDELELKTVFLFENFIKNDNDFIHSGLRYKYDGMSDFNSEDSTIEFSFKEQLKYWEVKLSEGEMVSISAIDCNSVELGICNFFSIEAMLLFPIFVNKKFWGSLGFGSIYRKKKWTSIEIDSIKVFAATTGAIFNFIAANNCALSLANDLEELKNEKFRFLTDLALEIITPLNIIVGFTRTLFNELPSEHLVEYLGMIEKNSHRILRITNEVSDISKIGARKLEITNFVFSTKELIESIVVASEQTAFTVEKSFSLITKSTLPQFSLGDEKRILQIINNIVSFCLLHPDSNSVSIQIDRKGIKSQFIISVKGNSLKIDHPDKIFSPFYMNKIIHAQNDDTGLELSIASRLASLLNGSLKVNTKVDNEITFNFMIEMVDLGMHNTIDGKEKRKISGYEGKVKRILVIDDNVMNRTMLLLTLKRAGFEMFEADTAEKGIKVVFDKKPDLILMDLRMQGIDGFEATRLIRKTFQSEEIKIFAVSASVLRDSIDLSIKAGCDEFIPKPINNEFLFDRIGNSLKLKWKYDLDVIQKSVPSTRKLNIPAKNILEELYNIALKGDKELFLEHIEKNSSEYPLNEEFFNKLKKLMSNFQFKETRDLIKKFMS